jgi:hypothetical protein
MVWLGTASYVVVRQVKARHSAQADTFVRGFEKRRGSSWLVRFGRDLSRRGQARQGAL